MSRRDEYLRAKQREKDFILTRTLIMSFFLSALRKEFGFGHDRLMRLLQAAEKEASFVESGMIGINDYIESVEESTGIIITDAER